MLHQTVGGYHVIKGCFLTKGHMGLTNMILQEIYYLKNVKEHCSKFGSITAHNFCSVSLTLALSFVPKITKGKKYKPLCNVW